MSVLKRRNRSAFSLVDLVFGTGAVILLTFAVMAVQSGCLKPGSRTPGLGLDAPPEPQRRAMCMGNLRTIGQAFHAFAADHSGRFPGRFFIESNSMLEKGTWQDILNREVFKAPRVLRWWDQKTPPSEMPGILTCPSLRAYGDPNRRPRPYAMNMDAAGGPDFGGWEPCGPYGKMLDPSSTLGLGEYKVYTLGVIASNFPSPSSQFLVCESEGSADEVYSVKKEGAKPNGSVAVGDSPACPPWSACQGTFAFRHQVKVESDRRHAATFLFIDGHVEELTPNARINAAARFGYRHLE